MNPDELKLWQRLQQFLQQQGAKARRAIAPHPSLKPYIEQGRANVGHIRAQVREQGPVRALDEALTGGAVGIGSLLKKAATLGLAPSSEHPALQAPESPLGRLGRSVGSLGGEFLPVAGDISSGVDAVRFAREGNIPMTALAAVGTLPVVPAVHRLVHYGKGATADVISPKFAGTGPIKGEERRLKEAWPEEHLDATYFFTEEGLKELPLRQRMERGLEALPVWRGDVNTSILPMDSFQQYVDKARESLAAQGELLIPDHIIVRAQRLVHEDGWSGMFARPGVVKLWEDVPTAPDVDALAAARHAAGDGATIDPRTGASMVGEDQWVVAAHKDREQILTSTPTKEDFAKFRAANADLLKDENAYLGSWFDRDTGRHILDVSRLYKTQEEALRAGAAANQEAIFHLGRMETVPVPKKPVEPPRLPGDATEQVGNIPGRWFSRLSRAIEQGPPRAPAQEWVNYLDPQKRGFSRAEEEWTGLRSLLANRASDPDPKRQMLTREDVQGMADYGQVRLKETVRGDQSGLKAIAEEETNTRAQLYSLVEGSRTSVTSPLNDGRMEGLFQRLRGGTEDPAYVLDAQDLPSAWLPQARAYADAVAARRKAEGLASRFGNYTQPGGENYREILLQLDDPRRDVKAGTHWDEDNVLAHIRAKDRTYNNLAGADERTLFVEEMQSDASQKARGSGHAINTPFESTGDWVELTVKRTLAEAAEGDYDRIAFVNGGQAADLYDLRHQGVRRLTYHPENETLVAYDASGNEMLEETVREGELGNYVGKDVARELLRTEAYDDSAFDDYVESYLADAEGASQDDILERADELFEDVLDVEDEAVEAAEKELRRRGYTEDSDEWTDEYAEVYEQAVDDAREAARDGQEWQNAYYAAIEEANDRLQEEAKDYARELVQENAYHDLELDDEIEFGGEGMKTFYDSIVPKTVAKYLKQFGATLEKIQLPDLDGENLSIRLTPELKQKIRTQGQRLLAVGGLAGGAAAAQQRQKRKKAG